MIVSFTQFKTKGGNRALATTDESGVSRRVIGYDNLYSLANDSAKENISLLQLAAARGLGDTVDLIAAENEGRLLAPIDHPEPSRLYVTGTGLTHTGSAAGRDAMHQKADAREDLTDSMKMFLMGVEGGKPPAGQVGVQPEWFYKGNGLSVVGTGAALVSPNFAEDGGEEPEIAGIYLIGPDSTPRRLGFALANEFSDHVTEKTNYLWLAHSKLRPIAVGPELLIDDLPTDVRGVSRILRDGKVLWEKPFLSGEQNMSHSIGNLEHHHFKYEIFCRPGDVHIHVFGTATLSFSDGVRTQAGDIFEISAEPFRLPLRNVHEIAQPKEVQILSL